MNVRNKLIVVLLAVGGLSLAACSSQQPATSPTADDSTGQFVWQDLMTDDVDAAMAFYGSLLGWEFEESVRLGDRYVLAKFNGVYIAGLSHVDHPDSPDEKIDQWLSYLSVPDVDRAVAQASRAGGEVLAAPVDLDVARAAVVTDANGALLGLLQLPAALSKDAQQALDAEVFIWRDYLAEDVDTALAFYRDIAGFEAERSSRDDAAVHYVLSRGEPRAGLFDIGNEPVKPNWLVYVKVADPAASARRVEQLGGQVILAPRADIRSGSLAIVADPGGAAIALQQWPIATTEDR